MRRSIFMTAFAVAALASCNRIDTPEMGSNVLDISVRNGMGTKAVVEGTTLPSGSEIGVFVTDKSGVTYEANMISNAKYSAVGENESQIWNNSDGIMLTETKATVNSYYPYDESVTDITAIPIEATSEVQKDWMWGTPVSGLDNKNPNAIITMNHALAAVRLNIVKGSYVGTGKVTSVSIKSYGAATSAVFNAKTGTLSSKNGQNTQFDNNEEFILSNEGDIKEFIVVPSGKAATININMIINDVEMKATTESFTIESGKIYEYTVSVGVEALQLNQLNIIEWVEQNMQEQMMKPSVPTVTISGTKDNIRFEQTYANKTLTLKAIPKLDGYIVSEATVTGGVPTQSVDENGVRTIVITDVTSSITVNMKGAEFVPWARIQHVDGTLYTAEEWLAAEEAGTVTDADANGVAVRYSKYASCPHVIHAEELSLFWSDATSMPRIPGVSYVTQTNSGYHLTDGKLNTKAILAAVANGTIPNAPAAEYCANITFANGQKGYFPALGEVKSWIDNKDIINSCMEAITAITITDSYWTSTAYHSSSYNQASYIEGLGTNAGQLNRNKLVRAITTLNL